MKDPNDRQGSRTQSGFGHISRPRRTAEIRKADEANLAEGIASLKGSSETQASRPTAEHIGIQGGQGRSGEDVRKDSHTSTWVVSGIVVAIIAIAAVAFFR